MRKKRENEFELRIGFENHHSDSRCCRKHFIGDSCRAGSEAKGSRVEKGKPIFQRMLCPSVIIWTLKIRQRKVFVGSELERGSVCHHHGDTLSFMWGDFLLPLYLGLLQKSDRSVEAGMGGVSWKKTDLKIFGNWLHMFLLGEDKCYEVELKLYGY